MSLPSFEELKCRADQRRQQVAVAIAGAPTGTAREAMDQACERGWIVPAFHAEPQLAVAAVRAGARLLVKGNVDTPALMHAILDAEHGLRTGRTIAQVVLMEIERDARTFLLADTGICIAPTLEQKDDILRHTIETAQRLGVRQVKVALLAASEKVTTAMPETVDAAELSRRGYPGASVHGPLSFDLAYSNFAGEQKRLESSVVGAANVMLFPNLLSANLSVKAIMYTADCRFGGVLCGTACPVVFMSRADTTETRINSLALALSLL